MSPAYIGNLGKRTTKTQKEPVKPILQNGQV